MPPAFFNWAEIFSRIFSCSALSGSRKRYHRASCSASALLTSASVGNLSMLIVPILLSGSLCRNDDSILNEASLRLVQYHHYSFHTRLHDVFRSGPHGSPIRRSRSAKRGSERISSQKGSTAR